MKFVCLGYMAESAWHAMSPSEQEAMVEECLAYDKVLLQNGQWTGAGVPLQNVQTAKTLRLAAGKLLVTDGPYVWAASTKPLGTHWLLPN